MKVSGYQLREAIRQHELRRETAAAQFQGSLHAFADEAKDSPEAVIKAMLDAESAIARLQVAQMRYNLAVMIDAKGEKMTLAEAIKLVGGVARAEKMYRGVAGPKKDRYGSYREEELERDGTKTFAKPTLTSPQAVKLAIQVGKRSSAIRASIATGNGVTVEIENLDAALFE